MNVDMNANVKQKLMLIWMLTLNKNECWYEP